MEIKQKYDIAIIGGGISGLGILLEAALNGFDAILFERSEVCRATSDNSLRIIHGGLRYLQNFDLARVRESAQAQQELLEDFPGAIQPLRCVMPILGAGLKRPLVARVGCAVYKLLYKRYCGKDTKVEVLTPAQLHELVPFLDAPLGALSWEDAIMIDPSEVVQAVRDKACACGAMLLEKVTISSVERIANGFALQLQHESRSRSVSASVVVNAAGPWYQGIGKKLRDIQTSPTVAWCRAFNLIVKRTLRESLALGVESQGGRLFFAVPRGQHTALGTQYLPYSGAPDAAQVTNGEVEAFLQAFHQALPAIDCARKDVVKVELGLLPIQPPRLNSANSLELIGRELLVDKDGFVDVISTKYTTFRSQARKVITLARGYIKR